VETAERSDIIDKERAQKAKERAEANLSKMSKEDIEYETEKAALARSIARLTAVDRHSSN
jgi:F-type H+-transporting ATPase subunit epsilon